MDEVYHKIGKSSAKKDLVGINAEMDYWG